MKLRLSLMAITLVLTFSDNSYAAYVRATSGEVEVNDIYVNEWGSPFVTFKTGINSSCRGQGLYLFNLEATPSEQLRNYKMAMLISAKIAAKKVKLDYFFDSSKTGWDACYIHGIYLTQ